MVGKSSNTEFHRIGVIAIGQGLHCLQVTYSFKVKGHPGGVYVVLRRAGNVIREKLGECDDKIKWTHHRGVLSQFSDILPGGCLQIQHVEQQK